MGRKEDLEKYIIASYGLIRSCEERIRFVDDPQAKGRYRAQRDEQWELIRGYLREYIPLCHQLGVSVPQDIAQLTTHFREPDVTVWSEIHVLFVDDEPQSVYPMIEALRDEIPCDVICSTSVDNAISVLESTQGIDLVITDLIMPSESASGSLLYGGLLICDAIQRLEIEIPVIVLSVVTDQEVAMRLRKLGVAAHLRKPIRLSELIETVQRVLRERRQLPDPELVRREINRRHLEILSDYPSDRIRAIWALTELARYDSQVGLTIQKVAESDKDEDVRKAARRAIVKLQKMNKQAH